MSLKTMDFVINDITDKKDVLSNISSDVKEDIDNETIDISEPIKPCDIPSIRKGTLIKRFVAPSFFCHLY